MKKSLILLASILVLSTGSIATTYAHTKHSKLDTLVHTLATQVKSGSTAEAVVDKAIADGSIRNVLITEVQLHANEQ